MLSRERAVKFLCEGLQIEDVEKKLESDRLLLLNEVLRHHVAYVPYQNMLLLAQNNETRQVPTFEQIIDDCTNLKGGTCSVLNIFLNILLKALGYNAEIQGCVVTKWPDILNQHFINLVRGVEHNDDLYLADPAAWYPSYEIIPLHTITTFSPVYRNAYMEYRFGKEGNIITRFTRKAKITLFTPTEVEDDWKPFYHFSLKSQALKDVIAGIQKTYDEKTGACLSAIWFTKYPFGKAVTFNGFVFRIWNEETLVKETKELKDVDEIYNSLLPFWKGADKEVLKAALHNVPAPKKDK